MIEIKIVNRSPHPLPAYETLSSAGMDLRAWLNEHIILKPMERKLFSTGLYMELPPGYEAQVRPRSGLALKHGVTVLNSRGTIDADYLGGIMVLIICFSNEALVVFVVLWISN